MVGTIVTFMRPFVRMRGRTLRETPQLKNASWANISLSCPGISASLMSVSSVLLPPLMTRLALNVT